MALHNYNLRRRSRTGILTGNRREKDAEKGPYVDVPQFQSEIGNILDNHSSLRRHAGSRSKRSQPGPMQAASGKSMSHIRDGSSNLQLVLKRLEIDSVRGKAKHPKLLSCDKAVSPSVNISISNDQKGREVEVDQQESSSGKGKDKSSPVVLVLARLTGTESETSSNDVSENTVGIPEFDMPKEGVVEVEFYRQMIPTAGIAAQTDFVCTETETDFNKDFPVSNSSEHDVSKGGVEQIEFDNQVTITMDPASIPDSYLCLPSSQEFDFRRPLPKISPFKTRSYGTCAGTDIFHKRTSGPCYAFPELQGYKALTRSPRVKLCNMLSTPAMPMLPPSLHQFRKPFSPALTSHLQPSLAELPNLVLTPSLGLGRGTPNLAVGSLTPILDLGAVTPRLSIRTVGVDSAPGIESQWGSLGVPREVMTTPFLMMEGTTEQCPDLINMIDDDLGSVEKFESHLKRYDVELLDEDVADYITYLKEEMNKASPTHSSPVRLQSNVGRARQHAQGRFGKRMTEEMTKAVKTRQKKRDKVRKHLRKEQEGDQNQEDHIFKQRIAKGGRTTRSVLQRCEKLAITLPEPTVTKDEE